MSYKNKVDQAISSKRHYEANKEIYKKRAYINKVKTIQKNKQFISSYLDDHHCVDCGNSDKRVLEFDHVKDTKLDNISNMVRRGITLKRIKQEIDKCEVRCANCHRIKTYETLWK